MDLNFKGRKALVRVDFNVPLDKSYQITDDTGFAPRHQL